MSSNQATGILIWTSTLMYCAQITKISTENIELLDVEKENYRKVWNQSNDSINPIPPLLHFEELPKAPLTSHHMCTYVLVTEKKSADLQGTLKLQLRFYNRILRLQTPCNGNWHANYSLRAHSMATNASISQG